MKKTSLLLILVSVLSALTGCNPANITESNEVSPVITDAPTLSPADEDLAIVSTVPSVTEILFALGCGENIVGVDVYSNYPDATIDIEKVGDYSGFDIEKVISLDADIVFAGNKLQIEQINTLTDLGINVVATEPTGFDDINTSITEIGALVGKESEAKELTDSITAIVDSIVANENIPDEKPTVYYVMGIGEYGNWTSGEGSFINNLIEMAGGICTTAGSPVIWMDFPLEDLIIADPDILIVSQIVSEADLLADPTYMELTAVKEGSYYFINPDIIERPGPRITEALKFIQNCIIGE